MHGPAHRPYLAACARRDRQEAEGCAGRSDRETREGRDRRRFRRQHPVGRFVLDFYCPAVQLVIEVDGEAHSRGDQPARDEARDIWCAERGLRVLRIPATLVMNDLDTVARGILAVCHEQLSRLPLHHSPEEANGPPPRAKHGEE
ncbi:MAG: DUF559 domain-containing protein [Candidatus Sphingomonas phytovorans]|nr:DUF559 domain-containing protein [Sphingomonas sp.]WEK02674.1 MAG: DUF559 domain-containing protein [Sphingomonas sp.]